MLSILPVFKIINITSPCLHLSRQSGDSSRHPQDKGEEQTLSSPIGQAGRLEKLFVIKGFSLPKNWFQRGRAEATKLSAVGKGQV